MPMLSLIRMLSRKGPAYLAVSSTSLASLNRRQGGVALISVLLIVAILVALSTQLLSNHNLVVSQHQNSFDRFKIKTKVDKIK